MKKLLLVEDDPSIRKVAAISLSRIGQWFIASAESGTQALALASDFQPDVILLDVMMPGMDGTTTFKLLRTNPNTAAIPIIFMTAKVQRQEVQSYYDLGAAGVIMKTFDPLTLSQEIEGFLKALLGIQDPTIESPCTA